MGMSVVMVSMEPGTLLVFSFLIWIFRRVGVGVADSSFTVLTRSLLLSKIFLCKIIKCGGFLRKSKSAARNNILL